MGTLYTRTLGMAPASQARLDVLALSFVVGSKAARPLLRLRFASAFNDSFRPKHNQNTARQDGSNWSAAEAAASWTATELSVAVSAIPIYAIPVSAVPLHVHIPATGILTTGIPTNGVPTGFPTTGNPTGRDCRSIQRPAKSRMNSAQAGR
jgi:hypothetical protein